MSFLHPHSILDLIGSILTLTLVSLILVHKGVSSDITYTGNLFSGALETVEDG
jgi:hypothetical protein